MHLPIMTVIIALPPPPPGPVTVPLSSPSTPPCMVEVYPPPPTHGPHHRYTPGCKGLEGYKGHLQNAEHRVVLNHSASPPPFPGPCCEVGGSS